MLTDVERHFLYVACTRATDHLLLTMVDLASDFMANSALPRAPIQYVDLSAFTSNDRLARRSCREQCSLRLAFNATFVRYVSVELDFQLTGAGP